MKVGGREILSNATVMVPDGEQVEFVCHVKNDDEFGVVFRLTHDQVVNNDELSSPSETSVNVDYKVTGNPGEIESIVVSFHNFSKAGGQSLRAPLLIATTDDGVAVSLLATVYKFSSFYKIEFQIMLGGEA